MPLGVEHGITMTVPPHVFFLVSAVFHYLGPAFAVLLFRHLDVLGVTWLRIASAALMFAVWRRPWRAWRESSPPDRWKLLAMGLVLAAMNACFYQAIARLPLGTVGGIEFLGPVALAAAGARSIHGVAALGLVVCGVWLLTDVRWASEPVGLGFAAANCALFVLYIVLGHRMSRGGGSAADRLGLAMLVALVAITPFAAGAAPAFGDARLLAAAFGVGVCSSVIPYVCDQRAMARLSRSTFALLLALLPATASLVGVIVLGQVPALPEAIGVGLVILGVAIHRDHAEAQTTARVPPPGTVGATASPAAGAARGVR